MQLPGMPLMIEGYSADAFELTMLLTNIRFITPGVIPCGPRILDPSRKNKGECTTPRIVMLVIAMSSTCAPSTVSSAKPRQLSKMQLEIVIFLQPPLDSVPHLILPIGARKPIGYCMRLKVPSSNVP